MSRLRATEEQHGVRILFAVESGSRAWGFASPNSDYDVRFIYARPKLDYISIAVEEMRDVIEYPIVDDIDLNGWDIRKALRLLWKSNPAFVEWLQSPFVYKELGVFASRARELLPSVYSPTSGMYHYRSMAQTNYRGYLRAEQVPLKKYFYVLRPLLSVRWLEKYGTPAPIEFTRLLEFVEDRRLLADIEALLTLKRSQPEMGLAKPVESIDRFITAELERLEAIKPASHRKGKVVPLLDSLFRDVLDEF